LIPRGDRIDQLGRLEEGLRGERAVGEVLPQLPEDADRVVALPLPHRVHPLREGARVERPVVVLGRCGGRGRGRGRGGRGGGAEEQGQGRNQEAGPGPSSQNFTVTREFLPPDTATGTSCSAPFGTNTTLT